jgi:hypothetical protein
MKMSFCAQSLAANAGFDLLGERLGGDVEGAISVAVKAGAVSPGRGDALAPAADANVAAGQAPEVDAASLRGKPQDLDEIALNGRTANGCWIAG